jgi:ribonuclease D
MNASAADGVKKNVALVQVASEERIALFHIARYPNGTTVDDVVAPTLKRIMESPKITKVGVSVKGDCTRLRKFMNIESRGIFELSHLYKLVKYSSGDVKKINKVMVNLAQQVREHLQLPLWKGEVRSSDWSQDLNYQQIQCKLRQFLS